MARRDDGVFTCAGCKQVAPRLRMNPSGRRSGRKRFCSIECYNASRAVRHAAERRCVMCGKNFRKKPGQPANNFDRQKCCSVKCHGERIAESKIRHVLGGNTCAVCLNEIPVQAGEDPVNYGKRQTCSRPCLCELRRRNATRGWPEHVTICGVNLAIPEAAFLAGKRPGEFMRRWKMGGQVLRELSRSRSEASLDGWKRRKARMPAES